MSKAISITGLNGFTTLSLTHPAPLPMSCPTFLSFFKNPADLVISKRIKSAKRLILCPNTDLGVVREYLANSGFEIEIEEIVHDYKYYQIIVCKYVGQAINYTNLELTYGPYLLKNKSKEFIEFHSKHLLFLENQLQKINVIEAKEKLINQIEEIKSILL